MYFFSSYDDSLSRFITYDLENKSETPAQWFVKELQKIYHEVDQRFENPKPMQPLTKAESESHAAATICHICEDPNPPFVETIKSERKIFEHCHLTGNDIQKKKTCFKKNKYLPIIFFLCSRSLPWTSPWRM